LLHTIKLQKNAFKIPLPEASYDNTNNYATLPVGKVTRNSRLEQGRKLKPEINSQDLQSIKIREKYAHVRQSKDHVQESRRKDEPQQKIIRTTES
jgi:hypothetical protein